MAKNTKSNKKSNARKLIPAAGMLAVSAVMLSTSTYAWFTMNKEVEVTGLTMSATAADALEFSLGARGTTLGSVTIQNTDGVVQQPADKDVSWTNAEVVGSYYGTVGKLIPASSLDAVNFFYTEDANDGGRNADNILAITSDTQSRTTATLTLNDSNTYVKGSNVLTTVDATNGSNQGFYIDVPVWLRTTKSGESAHDLYCGIQISRHTPAAGDATTTEQLYKALRVAFIPVSGTDNTVLDKPTTANANTTIFGISKTNYAGDDYVAYAAGARMSGTSVNTNVIKASTNALYYEGDTTNDKDTTTTNDYIVAKLKQTIPAATADAYGEQAFIVRVWLEGENENCWDMTSNQDWNINFAFALAEDQLPQTLWNATSHANYTVPASP